MSIEVKVPVLGESVSEATVGQWLKQPGEAVAVDEPIASLETDKVAVEVPSPVAGIMGAHVAAEGDTVAVGALLGLIETSGVATSPAPAPAAAPAAAAVADDAAALSPAWKRSFRHGDKAPPSGLGPRFQTLTSAVLARSSGKLSLMTCCGLA